jgi:hypothetical protein
MLWKVCWKQNFFTVFIPHKSRIRNLESVLHNEAKIMYFLYWYHFYIKTSWFVIYPALCTVLSVRAYQGSPSFNCISYQNIGQLCEVRNGLFRNTYQYLHILQVQLSYISQWSGMFVLFRYNLAAPYLRRLVAGFPLRRPGFELESGHVGFVVDKVALRQVFSQYFGFPCRSLFHQLLHNHRHLSCGLAQQASSGHSTKWTQSHSTKKNKKAIILFSIAENIQRSTQFESHSTGV